MVERKLTPHELIELMRSALILTKTAMGEATTVKVPSEAFGAIVTGMFEELCRDRRRS